MSRCEVCEVSSTVKTLYTCVFEDQPMLLFCREHWIEHVAEAHKDSLYAQQQLRAFKATTELTVAIRQGSTDE